MELERVTRLLSTRPEFFDKYTLTSSAEHDAEYIKTYQLKRDNNTTPNNESDDTEDQQNEFSLLGKTTAPTYGTTKLPDSVTINWKDRACEGYLFKRLSSHEWRKYFFVFIPDSFELRYYRTREKYYKNPSEYRGIISMTWYNKAKANEDDRLFQTQLKKSTTQVCTTRLVLFCTKQRHYVISSESDEQLEQWVSRWDFVINTLYTAEEIQIKKDAMRQQIPLFQQQARAQLEYYKMVVKALESAGLFASKPVNKEKEGYLYLQRSNKKWRQYYFIVLPHSISYFHLDDKNFPRGVITMLSIVEVAAERTEKNDNNSKEQLSSSANVETSNEKLVDTPPTPRLNRSEEIEKKSEMVHNQPNSRKVALLSSAERRDLHSSSEDEQDTTFIIRTHLRTYRLRAKHEAAMNDWVGTINRLRNKDKSAATRSPIVEKKLAAAEKFGQKINFQNGERIEVQYPQKKLFKLKKPGVITIGRSSKSDIVLDKDPRISRNHSKIEVRPSGVAFIVDLGSLGGTFVNGVKVTEMDLQSTDVIQLGDTQLIYEVKDSKNKTVMKLTPQ